MEAALSFYNNLILEVMYYHFCWIILLLGRKVMTNLDRIFKSRDTTLPTKVHLVKAIVFSGSHVWMWKLDCEESWVPKNWCFWNVVLKKTLESPMDCKEIRSVLWCSAFFMVHLSHAYMSTGKTIALTIWTFIGKVMSLLCNTLSRFVIAFLPRSKCLLI